MAEIPKLGVKPLSILDELGLKNEMTGNVGNNSISVPKSTTATSGSTSPTAFSLTDTSTWSNPFQGKQALSITDINPRTGTAFAGETEYGNYLQNENMMDQMNNANSFDWGGAANIGLSAFNSFQNYENSKMNRKAMNAQIGALNEDRARATKFANETDASISGANAALAAKQNTAF